jgi:hypothetical protein
MIVEYFFRNSFNPSTMSDHPDVANKRLQQAGSSHHRHYSLYSLYSLYRQYSQYRCWLRGLLRATTWYRSSNPDDRERKIKVVPPMRKT